MTRGGVDYPFDEPAAAGARVIFFCAAPGLHGRRTDEDFPGIAALIAPDGAVVARLPDWRAGTLVVDLPPGSVLAAAIGREPQRPMRP